MGTLLQDLRYGLRMLRKNPGFTVTALLSLAVAIGANAALFVVANAILWRTLPVKDPNSLVRLSVLRQPEGETRGVPLTLAGDFVRTGVFSNVVTQTADGLSFSAGTDRAERVVGEVVSPNFFAGLGVPMTLGPGFSADVQSGRWAAEAVLSYRFWQRRFSSDPQVLGRTVRLNNYPFTIVGVSAPAFYDLDVGFDPELRVPHMPTGQSLSQVELISSNDVLMVARLRPSVRIVQAETATDSVFQQFLHDHPEIQRRHRGHIRLVPGDKGWHDDLEGFRAPLFVLLALAGLVLLIACTNLASMQLARATGRRRELAVRAAIGAGRLHLIRQMLLESLILSVIGGAIGIAVASLTDSIIFAFLPQGHIQIALDLAPDARAVWFTIGITLLTSVLFGLTPALQATRGDLTISLKSDSAASIGDGAGARPLKALLFGQVTLSLVLLIMAGLFEQSLANLRTIDAYPNPDRVLAFRIKPQQELYDPARMRNLTAEVARRISDLPGVKSAAFAEEGPLGSRGAMSTVVHDVDGQTIDAAMDLVGPGFFATIGVPVLEGREFSPADKASSKPVAIINDVLARRLFKGENPLGRMVLAPEQGKDVPLEIVGVVRATRYFDLHLEAPPELYYNIQQIWAYMPTLLVRADSANVADVAAEIRREFDAIDKGFPVFDAKTLGDRINDSLASERLVGDLAGAFGVLALMLAMVGLYGITAFSVARRTREIGIRMALGARQSSILRMVLKESMLLVCAGAGVGVPVTLIVTRLIADRLFGVSAADPLTIVAATLLMIAVAGLASLVPAYRAMRVDPMVALHYE